MKLINTQPLMFTKKEGSLKTIKPYYALPIKCMHCNTPYIIIINWTKAKQYVYKPNTPISSIKDHSCPHCNNKNLTPQPIHDSYPSFFVPEAISTYA